MQVVANGTAHGRIAQPAHSCAGNASSNPTTNRAWSTGTFTAAGLAAINKAGRTQVRLAFSLHDNGNGVGDRMVFAAGDQSNPTLRPELRVTYVP